MPITSVPNFNTPTKEVEYYESCCKEFELTGPMASSIDGDRSASISAMPACDIICRAPAHSRDEFASDAEYELYKAGMYEEVLRIKSGMWMK